MGPRRLGEEALGIRGPMDEGGCGKGAPRVVLTGRKQGLVLRS